MHLGKEQSTGTAADLDDVAAVAAPAPPTPRGQEREVDAPAPVKADDPAPTGTR